MKKLMLIIAVLLGNCVSQPLDVPEFDTELQAFIWVRDEIKSVSHRDSIDILLPQHPEKTLSIGEGNCQDKTVLFMDILNNQFNHNSEFVGIESFTDNSHAMAKVNNKYYDIGLNDIYDNVDNISMIISYQDILFWSGFNR